MQYVGRTQCFSRPVSPAFADTAGYKSVDPGLSSAIQWLTKQPKQVLDKLEQPCDSRSSSTLPRTHVNNTDDFKAVVHILLRITSCTIEITETWECQPAVPKHAAPLAADAFSFGSASMSQAPAEISATVMDPNSVEYEHMSILPVRQVI
jgi:hypothetical protein